MKRFLIIINLKRICRFCSRGRIGYILFWPNSSEVMMKKIAKYMHVANWSLQRWPSLLPMELPLLLDLVLIKNVWELCVLLFGKPCNKLGLVPIVRGWSWMLFPLSKKLKKTRFLDYSNSWNLSTYLPKLFTTVLADVMPRQSQGRSIKL